jgi:flavin-dependent dehydrogenase
MLAKAGYKIIVFEKETYPFHRVCGEYISMESYGFLQRLGLDLPAYNLPVISKLIVSAPNGNFIQSKLDIGGFGISRYLLDNELKEIAIQNGVSVLDGTKVNEIEFSDDQFLLQYKGGQTIAGTAIGAYGKRSNLDVKLSRDFIKKNPGKLNNFVGVKYHVKIGFPVDTIALHNFQGGYCGLSKVEGDAHCLCYMTTAQNLKENNNSISEMERSVLFKNTFLRDIFSQAEFLFKEPVTISQISFEEKSQVEDHILMTGDTAGLIAPLCGNGMSIALHSAKIASLLIDQFLRKKISRKRLEKNYINEWENNFKNRLRDGRRLQKLFGKQRLTNTVVTSLKLFPAITQILIKATHGKEF